MSKSPPPGVQEKRKKLGGRSAPPPVLEGPKSAGLYRDNSIGAIYGNNFSASYDASQFYPRSGHLVICPQFEMLDV